MDLPFDLRDWDPQGFVCGTHFLTWKKFDDGYTYRWQCGCEACDSWVDHWIIVQGHGTVMITKEDFTVKEHDRMYDQFLLRFHEKCEYEQVRDIRFVHDQ